MKIRFRGLENFTLSIAEDISGNFVDVMNDHLPSVMASGCDAKPMEFKIDPPVMAE